MERHSMSTGIRRFLRDPETRTQLLLLASLLAGCFVIFRDYLFGNEIMVFKDVGSDTWHQYTMQFASIVNHLRDGTFTLWDFTNGFGTNLFAYNLFDPSLMILYLIGFLLGPAHMTIYINWIQVLKVLAAGWVFYRFLSEHSFSRQAKFMAAFAYGFNGYLMVWGQHYQFGMATVYLPLMLMFCERTLQKKKGRGWFPVTVFLSGIYSLYFTYMSLVVVGFYLLFRVGMLEGLNVRERAKRFFSGCAQILLGVGMSLVVFLPIYSVLFHVSARLDSHVSLAEWLKQCFTFYSPNYYDTSLLRAFSANLQTAHGLSDGVHEVMWNYYEDPVLFCSTLAILLNLQFLLVFRKSGASRRVKNAVYLAAALIVITLVLPLGGTVFNGFTVPSHRYTYVLMPFFLLATAWMWDYLKRGGRIAIPLLAASCALMSWVYYIGYCQSVYREYRINILILAATGWIMAFCIVLKEKKGGNVVMGVLLAALVVNVLSESGTNYQDRMTLHKEDTPLDQVDAQMLKYYEEASARGDMERMARALLIQPQEYFRQLYRQDLQDALAYLRQTDGEFYRVEKDFSSATISMDSLAQGYRGISTYNSIMNGNIKAFVEKCYPELCREDRNRHVFRYCADDNELASFAGIRYLLSMDDDVDPGKYRFVQRFGDVYLYENVLDADTARFYTAAISEESLKALCSEKTRGKLLREAIALEDGTEIKRVADIGSLKTQDMEQAEKDTVVTLDAPEKDSRVTGRVQAASDGYVMFMIPYEQGWILTVDGKETELLKADIGFLACQVDAGAHEFVLTFHAPLLKEGAAASGICWILFAVWLLYDRRRMAER